MSADHAYSDEATFRDWMQTARAPDPPSRCYYCGTRIHVMPHPPDTVRPRPLACEQDDCPGRRGPGTGGGQ